MKLFLFSILFLYLSPSSLSCNILTQAFNSVSNFHNTYTNFSCNEIQELNLSYKYLSGTVSWMLLKNISSLRSIDLSHNLLEGSVPGKFFSSSSLIKLNLANNHFGGSLNFKPNSIAYLNISKNRFTNAFNISGLSKLQSLDMSHNNLAFIPTGLEKLQKLTDLDFSYNSMHGVFPNDFSSIIKNLHFLNLSYNNFSGTVNSSTVKKFGASAFTKAGTSLPQTHKQKKPISSAKKKRKEVIIVVAVAVFAGLAVLLLLGYVLIILKRKRKINKGWKEEEKGVKIAKEVSSWVAEAKWAAPVVMFEKPLMELSFSDVAAATSGFSKEWQLSENISDSGPLYRAVLPGEMNVVVRVVETEVVVGVTEIAKLRHPNLLPLLGYCDAGKGKLLIYEYMEKGDLHQWLHELPANQPYPEDHTHDSYELNQNTQQTTTTTTITKRTRDDWPTRHNIALGIARGIAFLHQGWAGSNRPIVHPHLAPCNVLLDENLEPRISDFATGGGDETMEGNVYNYGVLVMELVTGRGKWGLEEVETVRRSIRDGKGLREVDPTMRGSGVDDDKWEKEMVDCLRVSYLCTAQSPEKRPKMQQVVGLIKDVRPTSIDNVATSSLLRV